MKVAELRSLLENYPDKQLREMVVALYKAMPKKLKEEQLIDELLKNPEAFLGKKKSLKKKEEIPDMDWLEMEIEEFLSDAYNQYYFAPNRIVPKSQRSKWRSIVKRFYKELNLAATVPENLPKAAELMQKIYEMLCYACKYILFSSDDVFASLRISKSEFLKSVLTLHYQHKEKKDFIRDSIKLVVDNENNYFILNEILMEQLIGFLKTPDLKEMTIQQCRLEIENTRRQLANPPKRKKRNFSSLHSDEYLLECKNNNLTILGVLCYLHLFEYDKAIEFYNEHYLEQHKEMALFTLLRLLFAYQLKDQWLQVYESAVMAKIKPREKLDRVYQHIKKTGELPEYM